MPSRKPGEMQHTSNDVMIFWMVTTCNFVGHVHRPAGPNIGEHIKLCKLHQAMPNRPRMYCSEMRMRLMCAAQMLRQNAFVSISI